ncbi:hypothetical protein K8I31_22370, partial [bacterium]|nr:hypothetical protein [bacterium]
VGLGSPEMLPGEHALLRETYQAFDHSPIRALYSERAPSDASTPYLDGALSYALVGGRFATQVPLNMLRFAQPRLRIIEKIHPSIEAHLIGPERAKLCVFNGEGMWLKGRPRSWYSKEFRQFINTVYPILQKHKDAFASRDVESLLPTLQAGVYANRFSTQDKHVITLYNNNYDTVSGRLFDFAAPNANASCDWGLVDFSSAPTDDGIGVSGVLHPKDVAIIVIEPTHPDRERGTE